MMKGRCGQKCNFTRRFTGSADEKQSARALGATPPNLANIPERNTHIRKQAQRSSQRRTLLITTRTQSAAALRDTLPAVDDVKTT